MGNLKLLVLVRGLAAGILLLAVAALVTRPAAPPTRAPRTLAEVARIARQLGLHCRSDRRDGGPSCRLILSRRPLTYERANHVNFRPGRPCWQDTVAVTRDAHRMYDDYERTAGARHPGWSARWGDFSLFGDPALIRALLGHD